MMRSLVLFGAVLGLLLPAAVAQNKGIGGDWRTPDGAIVRIAPCGQDFCATLVQLQPNAPWRFDTNNPDVSQHTRKLCGLKIGYGFHLTDPSHADDGHLYDPKSGKTYKGVISSEGDRLDLRGYVGIKAFGRSEHWTRTGPAATCSS